MYIDFDPKKLDEELKEKTLDGLPGESIPPGGAVTQVAYSDPNVHEDGGGGTVSDPGVLMYAEAGREDVMPM